MTRFPRGRDRRLSSLATNSLLFALCAAALAGCHLFPQITGGPERTEKETLPGAPGAPGKYQFRVGQFVFLSDFEIQRNLPLFKELAQMREQINKELRLPPSEREVFVYLFEDQEHYERYMQAKHPDLPKRRAFFLAQPRRLGGVEDLLVFTYWGHRIHQDLRHELTHAMLHSVLKDVPLWLDEGLAEYYETPPGWNGANAQHVESLLQANTSFNLERLEQLQDVQQMSPGEYREAWAWVHLMLHSSPRARQVLVAYLAELRTSAQPGLLQPRLATVFLSPDQVLREHLTDLDSSLKTRPASARR
jgi:hypothetical protein